MMTPAELEAVRALVDAAAPYTRPPVHAAAPCGCTDCLRRTSLILAVHAARNLIKANEGKTST